MPLRHWAQPQCRWQRRYLGASTHAGSSTRLHRPPPSLAKASNLGCVGHQILFWTDKYFYEDRCLRTPVQPGAVKWEAEGLEPLRKLRSYETLNRWSSGQTNYFGERDPGSIPGLFPAQTRLRKSYISCKTGRQWGSNPQSCNHEVAALPTALGYGGVGLEPSE